MTRSVFYGFGAFVGSITGPTTCGWWADNPALLNWDPAQQILVDLGKSPEAARRGLIGWNDIQADDYAGYAYGGQTQIGPMWPGGRMTGACYLSATYWNSLTNKPPRVPAGFQGYDYEVTTVLYSQGESGDRRFIGVHAEVRSTQGSRALLALWTPGTSRIPGQLPFGTFWIDLATAVDAPSTQISATQQTGAAFIDAHVLAATGMRGPKIPYYLGSYRLVGRSRARRASTRLDLGRPL